MWEKHQVGLDLAKEARALSREDREKRIVSRASRFFELRKQGKTLEEISRTENITRERVRQVLKAAGFGVIKLKRKAELKKCYVCGLLTSQWISISNNSPRRHTRCSKYDGGSREFWKKKRIEMWADPKSEFSVIHKKRMHDYWLSIKANPIKYAKLKEKQKIHTKNYHNRKRLAKST